MSEQADDQRLAGFYLEKAWRLEAENARLRAKLERVGRASIEEIASSDDDRVVLSCRLCGWSNRWRQSEAAWHAPYCVLAE